MTDATESPRALNVTEFARVMRISDRLAYELVRTGQVQAIRLGRRWVIPMRVVDELLGDRNGTNVG